MRGENNFVAGANIKYTDGRKNTFVWSDNLVRPGAKRNFTPAKDGVFLIRAERGLAINTPKTTLPGSVEVKGMVQLGNDTEACTLAKV